MTDRAKYPIDMFILVAGVLVVGVGLTWFVSFRGEPQIVMPEVPRLPNPLAVMNQEQAGTPQIDLATLVEMAALAQESGQLIAPTGASALHFYQQILVQDPHNIEALAGVEAIMADATLAVRSAIERERMGDAVKELDRVRAAAPEHPLVAELDATLAAQHQQYLDQARQYIGDKNFERAGSVLTIAALIPQGSEEELDKVKEELGLARISEVKRSLAAEQAAQAGTAAAKSAAPVDPVAELMEKVNLRIVQGQLVAPHGDSARFYLDKAAGKNATHPGIGEARELLADAMAARAETSLVQDDFGSVETWLGEMQALGADETLVAELAEKAELRRIELESARVIPVSDMTVAEYVPPKYPERAERKSIEGWVDLEFTVNARGETQDIVVIDASPKGLFESASTRAVSRWRFEPREFRGRIIDQRVGVRVNFTF